MKLRQFFLSKKKPLAMILGVSMFFLAAAVSAPSLAWFIEIQDKANTQNMSGVIHGAYFGGSGTEEDPYTISQPKQIYYFNWLQDIGYFNVKTSNKPLAQIYFKLEKDIDMRGFVLPPAGTTRFPFVGSFDGNGKTISNLTITNVYKDLTDPVAESLDQQSMGTKAGHLKTLNNNDCEIVGFFGVIGDTDGELTTNHRTGYLLDDGNQNYTYKNGDEATDYVVAANVVKNVAFRNLTVDSHTTNTLSGLAAGFVNGTMSRVAVDDSSLSFSAASPQGASTTFTNNLSDYSLVGYAAPQFRGNVQKAEAKAIAPTVDNPNTSQGGDQWGGSIDMRTMYKNVLATEQAVTSRVKYASTTSTYHHLNGETSTENEWKNAPYHYDSSSYYYYYFDGVTTDDADSYSQVFTLETAEKGDETGYCGIWSFDAGEDVVVKLVLASDGTGSLDGVAFTWNPSTHAINGFGSYDQGGTVSLNEGRITLSLNDSQKQTASMAISRSYSDSTEDTQFMYLSGGRTVSVDDTTSLYEYTETSDAVIRNGKHYLVIQKSGNRYVVSDTATFSSGTRFTLTNQGYLTASVGGTTVYLANSSGTLSANTSTKTVWTYDESAGTISSLYNGQVYYLLYNSGWTLSQTRLLTIYDQTKGYYLNYTGNDTPGYDPSSPTAWVFRSNHYSPISATSRYLEYYSSSYKVDIDTRGDAYLLNGQTSPYLGEGPLYANVSGTPQYLYFTGIGWNVTTNAGSADSFVISPMAADLYYFKLSSSSSRASSYTTKDTYFPITWADSSSDGSTVPTEVSDQNTGYVVSGGSDALGDIRVSSYPMSSLQVAFNSENNYSDSLRQRMEIVTRTYVEDDGSYTDSDWVRISDDDNKNNGNVSSTLSSSFESKKDYFTELKLQKYWNAKKGFKTMLSSDVANIYGLHFMDSAISTERTIEVPYAKINGQAHLGYELPEDCIDFNLASSGFVNFFAGTYYRAGRTGENKTFFSLNQIVRDANNEITDIHEISAIYLNSDSKTNESQPYYYTYTGGGHSATGSQGQQIFDMDWVMNPEMVARALYYFEIPVNSGEYALGSCSVGSGAYLLYLDIGASTANYKAVTITELITGAGRSLVYPLGVDFVHLTETTAYGADKELGGLTAAIIVPAQSKGVQHYKYDEDNERGSLVVAPPEGESFTKALKASFVANNVTATDAAAEATFNSTDCDGLTSSTMRIERVTSETYDLFSYTVTQQIDSVYTLTGIPGTTLQLYAGGAGNATWLRRSGDAATVDENGLVTFTGTGEVVIKSTIDVITSNVTEYSGPESVDASQDSAGGISYVITNGEASVSWIYDAYAKTYTVRVYSTVGATIAVTKPAEGYTIVITDGTNRTPITSASQTTTVNISANS